MDVRSFFGTPPTKRIVTPVERLVGLMTALPPATARQIANRSGSMDKHVINQLLYAHPELFCQSGVKGNAPLWSRIYR